MTRILFLLSLLTALPAVAGRPDRPTDLNKGTAMLAIYGDYSVEHGSTLLPYRYTAAWNAKGAEALATPVLLTTYHENGQEKAVLAVQLQDLDEGQIADSHASTAALSVYIFRRVGNEWIFEAGKKSITTMGSYGQLPDGQLVRIGSEKYGLMFSGGDMHQGYMNSYVSLISLSEGRPAEVLTLDMGGNNSGSCSDNEQERKGNPEIHPCWSYEVSLHFFTTHDRPYFTLLVQDDGTYASDDKADIVLPVHDSQYFTFANGQYGLAHDFNPEKTAEIPRPEIMEVGHNLMLP